MLSDDFLESAPDRLSEIYAQAEIDIIQDMARKLAAYDYYSSATEWQAAKLQDMGLTYKEIQKRLAQASKRSLKEIKALLQEAGAQELKDDDVEPTQATYDALNAGLQKTAGTFDNLTKTTAIYGSRQISEILDRAYMQVTSGAFSPDAAIRAAIKSLAKNGIAAYDYGTRKDYIDVVVRRATRTGITQTTALVALSNAEQLGTDLVEVSAHAGARPTHAEWQGKIYSISGKTKGYEKLSEATGYGTVTGLCGANCRHTFYPVFKDDTPAYTDTELQDYSAKNYVYNGQAMTEYEATQRQRYIERQLRRYKREKAGMQAAGLSTDEAQAKIRKWEKIQQDFIRQTGLKRQFAREEGVYVANGVTPKAPEGAKIDAQAEKKSPSKKNTKTSKNTAKTGAEAARTVSRKQAKVQEKMTELTDTEISAIQWYISGDGQWINQYLRGRGDFGKISETEQSFINAIDAVTSRNDVLEKKLYRSVDAEAIFGKMSQSEYERLYDTLKYGGQSPTDTLFAEAAKGRVGTTITEKGFMSTTKDYDLAAEWGDYTGSTKPVTIEFDVPEGMKGYDMKEFEVDTDPQSEVLLSKDTSYKIKEVGVKDGNIYVKAEMIPKEQAQTEAAKQEAEVQAAKEANAKRAADDKAKAQARAKAEAEAAKAAKDTQQSREQRYGFTPAKTIEEAGEYAKAEFYDADNAWKTLDIGQVSYKGVSIEVANEVNLTLKELFTEFDVEKLNGVIAPTGSSKWGKRISGAKAAFMPQQRTLLLTRSVCKDMKTVEKNIANEKEWVEKLYKNPQEIDDIYKGSTKQLIKAGMKSGRVTYPETLRGIIMHEFGHGMEKYIFNNGKNPNYFSISKNMQIYGQNISGYATYSYSEYVAESFAAYMDGNTDILDPLIVAEFDKLRRTK